MVGYLISLGIFTATFALFSLGLNLQWGYTGLINFGHVGFLAIGSYTTILLSLMNVPMAVAVIAGMILAMVLGLIMGMTTLRLREDYLAIVTIGMAEIVRLIALNEEWLTRGARGVFGFPLPLDRLEPSLPLKIAMIGVLTAIVVGVGWLWWQWLGRLRPDLSLRSPWLNRGFFGGFLISVAGLEWGLWQTIEPLSLGRGLNMGMVFLTLLLVAIALGILITRWQTEIPMGQYFNLGTLRQFPLLTLVTHTLGFGLVAMLYWANVAGLWNYTYRAGLLWLLLIVLVIVFWQLEQWVRSPWGRVLKSIREDEEVAKALGKNVFSYKLQSLMLGGAIAALAGSFYAWQLTFINPEGFTSLLTFQAWTIVVLGGAGNNVGTILGATIFWAYTALTRFLPLDGGRLEALRMMVIGLLLIILMMWRPQGILGKKEELSLGR